MSKKQVLEIMTMDEIKDRLKNPIKYKYNALHNFYSEAEERHRGNQEIIAHHKKMLSKLNTMNKKDIDNLFSEIFDDEPSDKDIAKFKKIKIK